MKYESHNNGNAYMRRDCWILLSTEVMTNVQNKWWVNCTWIPLLSKCM